MPRTKHLCAQLCAPLFDPLVALCLPLVGAFLFPSFGTTPDFNGWDMGLGRALTGPQPSATHWSTAFLGLPQLFHPATRAMPTLPPYACLPQVGLSYYRHGKCSGRGGVCRLGWPPHFVWERGTASGAFGPLGGILGQKATNIFFLGGQLFRARGAAAGGTQWCPVVQLGAGEGGAGGLWACVTGLPPRMGVGGWSQNRRTPNPFVQCSERTND
jgi:hypothetical protein